MRTRIPKMDRISRRRGKLIKRWRKLGRSFVCSCFLCVGRETARWSKRELAQLSVDVSEVLLDHEDLHHDLFYSWERDLPNETWWPLDNEEWERFVLEREGMPREGTLRVALVEALR